VPLEPDDFPELLDVGRILIVACEDEAMKVTVQEIDADAGWIKVAPAIPGSGLSEIAASTSYTRHGTIIHGNVVTSGHGESRPEKILGSGDATRSGQRFDLDAEEVSFVVDSRFSSGVRAAVEVSVDGRTWQQMSTLNDSEPEAHHYLVRMKEDGKLTILFGDGRRGRRLPTGNNNVRIRFRQGTGLSGNLEAYSLEKEVKPHPFVESVLQPVTAAGGNDMESIDSMRENGPASVLTLERAVSIEDFTHLAASNSGVWQARAFRRHPGLSRAERIEVAVVPAGGGSLGTLAETLEAFLAAHALPNVEVTVVPYQSLILDLSITIRVRSEEVDPVLVTAAVQKAVLDAFSLRKAKLGRTFYSSEAFAVVEAVQGVENCRCVINPDGFRDQGGAPAAPRGIGTGSEGIIRRVTPEDGQVIHMDETASVLEIITQEFDL
jgi:predicted phage baseplate assembly protein